MSRSASYESSIAGKGRYIPMYYHKTVVFSLFQDRILQDRYLFVLESCPINTLMSSFIDFYAVD